MNAWDIFYTFWGFIAVIFTFWGFIAVIFTFGYSRKNQEKLDKDVNLIRKIDRGTAIYYTNKRGDRIIHPKPELQSDQFEAYTYCGKCNSLDVHYIRLPNENDTRDIKYFGWFLHDDKISANTAIYLMSRNGYNSLERRSLFSVVRTCKQCGHEWGQK